MLQIWLYANDAKAFKFIFLFLHPSDLPCNTNNRTAGTDKGDIFGNIVKAVKAVPHPGHTYTSHLLCHTFTCSIHTHLPHLVCQTLTCSIHTYIRTYLTHLVCHTFTCSIQMKTTDSRRLRIGCGNCAQMTVWNSCEGVYYSKKHWGFCRSFTAFEDVSSFFCLPFLSSLCTETHSWASDC